MVNRREIPAAFLIGLWLVIGAALVQGEVKNAGEGDGEHVPPDKFFQTFKDYPLRMKAPSFSVDQVMEALEENYGQ